MDLKNQGEKPKLLESSYMRGSVAYADYEYSATKTRDHSKTIH